MLQKIRLGESLILLTGILLVGNVWYIAATSDFTYWLAAKILFFAGVTLFIFDR